MSAAPHEAICTRYSHVYGNINLYSPDSEPSHWGELGWKLVFDKYEDEGRREFCLKAEHAMFAFQRPALIQDFMLYTPAPETVSQN